MPDEIPLDSVDVWFQDESRIGQQGSQTRLWAPTGTRPRAVKQQQFLYTYIFGAVCPEQKSCAALVWPEVNHIGLGKHLQELSWHVPKGRHALVVMDRAGWHRAKDLELPENISILHLPPYSPELNPQEQVWEYLKDRFLSNRVFKNYEEIVNVCCEAWSSFASEPDRIASLTQRKWATPI